MTAKFNKYTIWIGEVAASKKEHSELRAQFLEAAQKVGGKGFRVLQAPERMPDAALVECTDACVRKLEEAGLSKHLSKDVEVYPASPKFKV